VAARVHDRVAAAVPAVDWTWAAVHTLLGDPSGGGGRTVARILAEELVPSRKLFYREPANFFREHVWEAQELARALRWRAAALAAPEAAAVRRHLAAEADAVLAQLASVSGEMGARLGYSTRAFAALYALVLLLRALAPDVYDVARLAPIAQLHPLLARSLQGPLERAALFWTADLAVNLP